MRPFREIEWRSPDLICSGCGTCSMTVFLRCDGVDHECLTIAFCRRCSKQYHAEVLPTYRERYQMLQIAAEQAPCPVCHTRPRILRYLCDRTLKECFFLLACPKCGDVACA